MGVNGKLKKYLSDQITDWRSKWSATNLPFSTGRILSTVVNEIVLCLSEQKNRVIAEAWTAFVNDPGQVSCCQRAFARANLYPMIKVDLENLNPDQRRQSVIAASLISFRSESHQIALERTSKSTEAKAITISFVDKKSPEPCVLTGSAVATFVGERISGSVVIAAAARKFFEVTRIPSLACVFFFA